MSAIKSFRSDTPSPIPPPAKKKEPEPLLAGQYRATVRYVHDPRENPVRTYDGKLLPSCFVGIGEESDERLRGHEYIAIDRVADAQEFEVSGALLQKLQRDRRVAVLSFEEVA